MRLLSWTYWFRALGWFALLLVPVLFLVWLVWKVFWLVVLLAARFLSGSPMLGADRETTDATFWSPGTGRTYRAHWWQTRDPGRWSLRPYYQRAMWRLGVLGGAFGAVYVWLRWPTLTEWSVAVVAAVVLGFKEAKALHWCRLFGHMRRFVKPLHAALAPHLGIDPAAVRPQDWLHIPPNFADADAQPRIRVDLPPTFNAGVDEGVEEGQPTARDQITQGRRLVDDTVFSRLKLNPAEMTATYRMAGMRPWVEYRHLPAVPGLVTPDMVRGELEKATTATVVFGVGKGGRVKKINLDHDHPHVMLSVPTGGGKTWTVRAAITPMLPKEQDVRVAIFDVKHASHLIYKEHPHVRIIRHIGDIFDELKFIGPELDRRYQCIWNGEDPGPRLVVVIEEADTLVEMLQEYWQDNKPTGHTGGNPAIAGLRRIPSMGREARAHQILVSQTGSYKATGGSRTNYGNIFIGHGAKPSAWKMVDSDMRKPPKKKPKRGRMYEVGGAYPDDMQIVGWDDDSVREYSFRGYAPEEIVSGSLCDRETFYQGKRTVTVTDEPVTGPTLVTEEDDAKESPENTKVDSYEAINIASGEQVKSGNFATSDGAEFDPVQAEKAAMEFSENLESETPKDGPSGDDDLVTLREAYDRGVVYANRLELRNGFESFRRIANSKPGTARYDPNFPKHVAIRGRAKVYRAADLAFWDRNFRPGASNDAGTAAGA